MKFIIIDNYSGQHCEIEAETVELAAAAFANANGRHLCLSPHIRLFTSQPSKIQGAVSFADEGTVFGWGPNCKFQGQQPKHQLIFDVVPVTP